MHWIAARPETASVDPSKTMRLVVLSLFACTLNRGCDGHGRPRSACRGDPLIVIEREAALEIRLDFDRPAPNVPGAIGILSIQQKAHALLIPGTVNREETAFAQCVQRFACRERIAGEIRIPRPAAVLALFRD